MEDARPWHILLVEDDQEDYLLTREMLKEARGGIDTIRWVVNSSDALRALEEQLPDVVLVDYYLGSENGLDLVRHALAAGYSIPFILLTGRGSYDVDLKAMQAGAVDYISKTETNPALLERVIRYALERHRLREEIVHQNRLLETVLAVDPSAIALFTGPELRVSFANTAFRAFLPSGRDNPVGIGIHQVFPENILPLNGGSYATLDKADIELDVHTGRPRHFICHLRTLFWQGWPAVLLIAWETTQLEEARRQVEQAALEALRRAEELKQVLGQLETEQARLNAVFANAPSAILLVDQNASFIYANPVAERLMNRPIPFRQPFSTHAELGVCRSNGAPYSAEDLPLTRTALRGERHSNLELLIVWPDGQRRSVLFNSAPIYDNQGKIAGAVGVLTDITEHKKAQEEIRSNLAQIEMQHLLMQSREKERLRIAQDLHDGPIQDLIALSFMLRDIRNELAKKGPSTRLEEAENMLQEQIRGLRSFMQQLRPPVLTPFGLEKAIRSHAEQFQAQHPDLRIGLALQPDRRALNEDTRLALFRIYQELMKNIVRHAKASEVEVRLSLDPEHVELQISDDGCGFDVPDSWVEMARKGHLGLVGVQERASSVDGFVDIISNPGKGTTVRVTAPTLNRENFAD